MKQFRKKPVVVHAIQFDGNPTQEVISWTNGALFKSPEGWRIKTLEGHSYVLTTQDMIVRGVKGEFYPCKVDIWYETHEEVEEYQDSEDDYIPGGGESDQYFADQL